MSVTPDNYFWGNTHLFLYNTDNSNMKNYKVTIKMGNAEEIALEHTFLVAASLEAATKDFEEKYFPKLNAVGKEKIEIIEVTPEEALKGRLKLALELPHKDTESQVKSILNSFDEVSKTL